MNATTTTTDEMEALKVKLKGTWTDGDYGQIAPVLAPTAHEFLSRIAIPRGGDVLDVACGTGQVALPAARAGARTTGLDIAPNLIAQARARAEAEGLDVTFDEGDAEAMPYEDASFDLVISLVGAMFAPRPDRVASELKRVCRPGGRIIMWNWTPEGFVGKMFGVVAKHAPPPPGMPSPAQWGVESVAAQRLGGGLSDLQTVRRMYTFRYPFGPSAVVDHFREHFGPVKQAFERVGESGEAQLHADLEGVWSDHNLATDGTTHVEAEILEVIGVRA